MYMDLSFGVRALRSPSMRIGWEAGAIKLGVAQQLPAY